MQWNASPFVTRRSKPFRNWFITTNAKICLQRRNKQLTKKEGSTIMSELIKNRYDFALYFDVTDGNPNGDPDAGNYRVFDAERYSTPHLSDHWVSFLSLVRCHCKPLFVPELGSVKADL
jgi:hypothetical protein